LFLLWPNISRDFKALEEKDEYFRKWFDQFTSASKKTLIEEVANLPKADPRRLATLNPSHLRRILSSKENIHLQISENVGAILDIISIQRSSASSLPVSQGEPISLRRIFKKINRKTAFIKRKKDEEIEY
jgi:hypothetical protein